MTRDYAKYNFSSPLFVQWLRHCPPRLLLGAIGGGVICLSLLLYCLKPNTKTVENSTAPAADSDKALEQESAKTKKGQKHTPVEKVKPRFDFYTLLPQASPDIADPAVATESDPARETTTQSNIKVATPSSTALASNPASSQQSPATANPAPAIDANFVIQAGSFKSHEEADNLRAHLSLLGFDNPFIKEVNLDSRPWYRVYVGPFSSKAEALGEQQRLEHQKLSGSLILKIRS